MRKRDVILEQFEPKAEVLKEIGPRRTNRWRAAQVEVLLDIRDMLQGYLERLGLSVDRVEDDELV